MEFKWTINKVKVAENNLIVNVDLTVTAIDGNNNASAAYSCDLARSDSFTDYDQLTEQQVLDWCFAPQTSTWINPIDNTTTTITRLLKDEGEAQVVGQIQRQRDCVKSEPALPWA